MDDQHPTLFPNPFLPEPPPPAPRQHRTLKVLGLVTATAVVTGVGGVGAGYAIGHGLSGSSNNDTNASGPGRSNVSTNGSGGTLNLPSDGGWSWSGGGQDGFTVPSDPFGGSDGGQSGGQSGGQQGQSSDSTTRASGSQLTGLVRITTKMKYSGGRAAGTGMVLTSDGEVVTNHHVVAGSTSIKVKVMSTGTSYTAHVVGTDTKDDVAVLALDGASGLDTITPDSDGIGVGDAVTAVGDANGTSSYFSAATGSVLSTDQSITTRSEPNVKGERLGGLLQISSDVISGDSGGATYDADGQVVGMTTAASSGGDPVGYAVPIAKVLKVADDLDSHVSGSRYDYGYSAFLGVGLGETGTTVKSVFKGTPAAQVGIVSGDDITAVGSTQVRTSSQLHNAVAALSPGDTTSVTWTDASGSSHTATVTLAQGPVG